MRFEGRVSPSARRRSIAPAVKMSFDFIFWEGRGNQFLLTWNVRDNIQECAI